jgi:Uma2 family endonuclease
MGEHESIDRHECEVQSMTTATLPVPPPRLTGAGGETCPFGPVYRLSVEQYRQMAEVGILTKYDKVELLEGWLVAKMTKNAPHEYTISIIEEVLNRALPPGWFPRFQSSTSTPDSFPEPDIAVVRGVRSDYRQRHPGPDDVGLVIEVADTTLARDRLKRRLYARAGLPVYWIVNLPEQVLEVYTEPDSSRPEPAYRQTMILTRDKSVSLTLADASIMLPVADLLSEE